MVRSLLGSQIAGVRVKTRTLVLLLTFVSTSVLAQSQDSQGEARTRVSAESEVDCLLPSQIRRYGQQENRLAPRRVVKATAQQCEQRNGEVVVIEGR